MACGNASSDKKIVVVLKQRDVMLQFCFNVASLILLWQEIRSEITKGTEMTGFHFILTFSTLAIDDIAFRFLAFSFLGLHWGFNNRNSHERNKNSFLTKKLWEIIPCESPSTKMNYGFLNMVYSFMHASVNKIFVRIIHFHFSLMLDSKFISYRYQHFDVVQTNLGPFSFAFDNIDSLRRSYFLSSWDGLNMYVQHLMI